MPSWATWETWLLPRKLAEGVWSIKEPPQRWLAMGRPSSDASSAPAVVAVVAAIFSKKAALLVEASPNFGPKASSEDSKATLDEILTDQHLLQKCNFLFSMITSPTASLSSAEASLGKVLLAEAAMMSRMLAEAGDAPIRRSSS